MYFKDKGGQEGLNLLLGEDEEEESSASDAMSCLVAAEFMNMSVSAHGWWVVEGEIIQEVRKEETVFPLQTSDREELPSVRRAASVVSLKPSVMSCKGRVASMLIDFLHKRCSEVLFSLHLLL